MENPVLRLWAVAREPLMAAHPEPGNYLLLEVSPSWVQVRVQSFLQWTLRSAPNLGVVAALKNEVNWRGIPC